MRSIIMLVVLGLILCVFVNMIGEQSTIPRIITYIKHIMSIATQHFSFEFMCHPGISKTSPDQIFI